MEETDQVPMDVIEKMAKLGYMRVMISRECEGLGRGTLRE